MLSISQTFTAGQTVKFIDLGNFHRLISTTANVTVRTYKNGTVLSESVGVSAGFAEQFDDQYDAIEIYSASAQTIQFVSRLGAMVFFDAPPTGNVSVTALTPVRATFANTAKTVTNATTQLVAANASRNYLLIQNKDASGKVYVNFGAGAATVANGLLIGPGGTYELNENQSITAIQAIGDIASNANVVVVEG